MLQLNKSFFSGLLCALALTLSGCTVSVKTGDTSNSDSGLWVSGNKGESWVQMSSIPTIKGAPGSISGLDASVLVLDPANVDSMYFGTAKNGLYQTDNLNLGWNKVESLPAGEVNAVAVSPDNRCSVYVAAGNKVQQSTDCLHTWSQIYFDNNTATKINSIAVDHYDANKVYIGTSRGEVIKSEDRGKSWKTVLRAPASVNDLVVSPQDSRTIFAVIANEGLYRTLDGGENWVSLKERMTEFKNSYNIITLISSPAEEGLLFAATTYGLLKSSDNGDNWSRLELITPEKEASINALAVNPKSQQEIYYVTKTTFYSSSDGGKSWRTKKLPSTRAGWRLIIKPDQPNIIFMTMKRLQNSQSTSPF